MKIIPLLILNENSINELRKIQYKIIVYLPGPLMSLISTLRNGRKGFPQKGQVVFRLESSAVQPAMISSSYTRQSHVLQREQLEISSWKHTQQEAGEL